MSVCTLDSWFVDTAGRLENAYDRETKLLALTIVERESILRSLEDCAAGLAERQAVLMREYQGRVELGL